MKTPLKEPMYINGVLSPVWIKFLNKCGEDSSSDEIAGQIDVNAYGKYAVLFMAADGHYDTALATATTTMPAVVMALESGTGAGKAILRRGEVENPSWTWTIGPGIAGLIYVSASTAGALVQGAYASFTSGQYIQPVGYALSATKMYFNPSLRLVKVA